MQIQTKLRALLLQAVFVPAAFLALTIAGFSLALSQYSHSLKLLEHSNLVLQKISELKSDYFLHQAQYSGYAVSGTADFLHNAPSIKDLTDKINSIRTLTADNPFQAPRIEKLQATVFARGKYSQQLAYLAKVDRPAALKLIVSRQGEEISDQFAQSAHEAVQVELRLQTERKAVSSRNFYVTNFGIIPLVIIVLILLAYQSRRNLLQLSQSYEELMASKDKSDKATETDSRLRRHEAEILGRLATREDPATQLELLLAYVAREFQVLMGAAYLQEDQVYRIKASIGLNDQGKSQSLEEDHNLLSHALQNTELKPIENNNPDLWSLHSAVTDIQCRQLLLAPIHFGGDCLAILELGLTEPLSPELKSILQVTSEKIGALLSNSVKKEKLKILYEELQVQSEELQAQQEELKASNEELQIQSMMLLEQKELIDARNRNLATVTQEIEKQRKDLEKVSQYKSQFLANLSHELRTPLNSSMVLSQLLVENRSENLDPQQIEMVRQIYKSEKQLIALIGDILDLSKIESGVLTVHIQEVPTQDLLLALKSTFDPLAEKKGIQFTVEDKSDILSLTTDRLRLEQLLNNLISNAIKFTDDGGVVLSVSSTVDALGKKKMVLSVADTGEGIPPDQLEAIFEPFRQLEIQPHNTRGGTGLGLSICRQLAKLLDAEIQVVSELGTGSVFTLTLPIHPQAPLAQIAKPEGEGNDEAIVQDDRASAGMSSAVLVIESEASVSTVIRDRIRGFGLPCIVTRHAEEGVTLALEYRPLAVILDMHLPDSNALYALSRLKSDPSTSNIPIYTISNFELPQDAKNQGAIELLSKPVSFFSTSAMITRIENQRSQYKEKKILLIEDDPMRSRSILKALNQNGISAQRAGSGRTALQLLRADLSIDTLFIHSHLHDISAGSLLRELEVIQELGHMPLIKVYSDDEITSANKIKLLRPAKRMAMRKGPCLEKILIALSRSEPPPSIDKEQQADTKPQNLRREFPSIDGRRILLVDDDFRNVFSLTSALELRGAKVTMAENGQRALDILAKEPTFDAILMDIMMPGMDGYETIRRIRGDLKLTQVPILALTAKAMKDDREQSLKAGANDYLTKPIDLKQLYALLSAWTTRVP